MENNNVTNDFILNLNYKIKYKKTCEFNERTQEW